MQRGILLIFFKSLTFYVLKILIFYLRNRRDTQASSNGEHNNAEECQSCPVYLSLFMLFLIRNLKKSSLSNKELEKALNNVTNELNETKNLVAALKLENEETKVF